VIVGFPGEDYAAFGNTRAMIEEMGLSRLHVFRYSSRPRTAAAGMAGHVDENIKKLRAQNLIELGKLAVARFALSLVGESVEVLVESRANSCKHLAGFADNYIEVRFPGSPELRGEIVNVKITGVDENGACMGVTAKGG
jgi:threonylcarbamoyladenosine tRNA methylthiotransferase MtaB